MDSLVHYIQSHPLSEILRKQFKKHVPVKTVPKQRFKNKDSKVQTSNL